MARHQPADSSQRPAQDNSCLPKGFISIRDLLEGTVASGKSINLVGVVKDYRLPIPTKGRGECALHPLMGIRQPLMHVYRLQMHLDTL